MRTDPPRPEVRRFALLLPYLILGLAMALGLYLVRVDQRQNDRLVCETLIEDRNVIRSLLGTIVPEDIPASANPGLVEYIEKRNARLAAFKDGAEDILAPPADCARSIPNLTDNPEDRPR